MQKRHGVRWLANGEVQWFGDMGGFGFRWFYMAFYGVFWMFLGVVAESELLVSTCSTKNVHSMC